MNRKPFSERNGTFSVLSFMAVALILVLFILGSRLDKFLTSFAERQTEKAAEAYALLMEEKLETEIENLEYIAAKLETSLDDMDDLMPALYNDQGIRQGLLGIDGQALYGENLSAREYQGIQSSFRGEKAISYVEDKGLLFTCPVFNGPNIRYVLYRLSPSDVLEKYFAARIYDDLGKMCVTTRDGKIVVPFYQGSEEDRIWYESKNIQEMYFSMHMEMEISFAVATTFTTDRGKMLLFEAEIPGTDFLVSGYVPKATATEGIANIRLLVIWVYGLLMLLMLIGAYYLTRVVVKASESDELREAKAEAEEASKAKGEFLANMSHEIRTPINAVLGMNEMILREARDTSILTYANNVKSAGTTLLGIVNDILDFSKIEAGKIEIIPVDYDLSSALFELVNMVRSKADEKGLLVNLDFDPSTPKILHGDEVRIKQVITNILTNAVKYTEKGCITFSVGYDRINEDQIYLKVAVEDTGIGIREEDMEKLFSEFDRIEEKRNRHIEGTGLGMSITKNLLDLMGSKLEVKSVYGEGSVFSFSIQQDVADEYVLGDYEAAFRSQIKLESYHESFTAPSARVLVVDDNTMNLAVFNSLIKQTLVSTDTAESGDAGLALMRKNHYDMIFLDHMMPEKDGIETLHEMKAWESNPNQDTPVICLTANAISGARDEYISAGFDDYLTKPIDPDQLEKMMRTYLPEEKVVIRLEDETETKSSAPAAAGDIPDELLALSDAGIDVNCGIKNSGTVDAYLPILQMFYKSIGEKSQELSRLIEVEDYRNFTIKVHALKSSARIVGALSFGEEAQALEDAGKGGNNAYIRNHYSAFLKQYESFTGPLSAVFPSEETTGADDNDRPEADESLMKAVFAELAEAADMMDIDRIEEIFGELKEYRIPDAHKEKYEAIIDAAERFDYGAIVEAGGIS